MIEIMPTSKQRLTMNIPEDLYKALSSCCGRTRQTFAKQAAIALEEFLLKTGDLSAPVNLPGQGRPRHSASAAENSISDRKPKKSIATDGESIAESHEN
jgi:hypothetical protein